MSNTQLPQSGVVSVVFNGAQQYRGASYYSADFAGGAFSNGIRTYYESKAGAFEERAENDMQLPIIPGCGEPKREAMVDQDLDFTVAANVGGQVALYQCSAPFGSKAWSFSSSDAGSAVVTVAAGTFATHVWNLRWTFGTNERDSTLYVYGVDLVERDTTESNGGSPFATYTLKLRSGPTDVAMPMAPVMYPYDF